MKIAHWPLSEWPFGQNWLLCIWIESIFCLLAGRWSNNQYDNELSKCRVVQKTIVSSSFFAHSWSNLLKKLEIQIKILDWILNIFLTDTCLVQHRTGVVWLSSCFIELLGDWNCKSAAWLNHWTRHFLHLVCFMSLEPLHKIQSSQVSRLARTGGP